MSDKLRILVVDDDRNMANTLVDIFMLEGYEAEAVHSGSEAMERVGEGNFDCVLSDIKMPEVDGVELYRAIKANQPAMPVVLMTAYTDDKLVREGLEEGVIATLTKPLDIDILLSFFSTLCKERYIVIVDDDPQFCKTLGDILREQGFAVNHFTDPSDIVMERLELDGQVVLLDMKLKDTSGLEVLKEIRKQHPHLPVILVTGYREEMSQAIEAALKINAYDCLYKPLEIEKLFRLLSEIYHQELGRVLGKPVKKKN